MSAYRKPSSSDPPLTDLPPDVSLLLRAHSEQHWLSREVIPVVRQIKTGERLPEEQLPAAAAYLEVIWIEAAARARVTDDAVATLRQLEALDSSRQPLSGRAHRYYAAVKALREAVARWVASLLATPSKSYAQGSPPAEPAANLHDLIT
jgi:hypothetical protein